MRLRQHTANHINTLQLAIHNYILHIVVIIQMSIPIELKPVVLCYLVNNGKVTVNLYYKITPLNLEHAKVLLGTRSKFDYVNGRGVFVDFNAFDLGDYNQFNGVKLSIDDVLNNVKKYKSWLKK